MLKSDASSLKGLGKSLRKAQPAVYQATQRALRVEGKKVAQQAKQNFGWSTRIPATVTVRVSGVNSVIISAGGESAPHAKAIEHAGAEGFFRHPLNWPNQGDRANWVDQKARPSLHPAALARIQESAEAVAAALTVQVEKTIHGQDVFV